MKQHQDACKRSDEVRVVDKAIKNREIKIKKVLCIQMTPHNKKFNRDIVLSFQDAGCLCCMLITLQKSCCLQCIITESSTSVEP